MLLSNILAIIAAASVSVATPITLESRETAAQATDRLLFSTPMTTFLEKKRLKNPGTLDWTDDGCSFSPDKPAGYNFLPACKRHDFGYRNYKKQHRCATTDKSKVDVQLSKDLHNVCSVVTPLINKVECLADAELYFVVVSAASLRLC